MTPKPRSATGQALRSQLVDAVSRGEQLDLAPDCSAATWDDIRGWGAQHKIPARWIRDILRGVDDTLPKADPHGVRIRGAVIDGRLDLENIDTAIRLELEDSILVEGLTARDAKIPGLVLNNCILEHTTLSPLNAERLTARAVRLEHVQVNACAPVGAMQLRNGHVGVLTCIDTQISNSRGAAIDAECLKIEQAMAFTGHCVAIGTGEGGAVVLHSASIGAQLDCSGARMENSKGPALNANNLQVAQDLFLGPDYEAHGAGPAGAVRLSGARIGGQLAISGTLRNTTGPAFSADGMWIANALMLRADFKAFGQGAAGAVRMAGAHVGQIELDGARIENTDGPALNAPMLHVDNDLFLRAQFKAVGSSTLGAVRLPGARIGRLDCTGSTLANDRGPALHADGASIAQGLILRKFTAEGAGQRGVISLVGADVGGEVAIDFETLVPAQQGEPLAAIGDFKYTSVPTGSGLDTWLYVLAHRTPTYLAQPYQQLAGAYRATGDDRTVRRILMAQRHDQIRHKTNRWERMWSHLSGGLLGWGYQPWRALIALGLVIASLIALAQLKPDAYVYGRASQYATNTCSNVDRIGTAIDAGLPLVKTSAHSYCDFDSHRAGYAITVLQAALQVLSWAFATLFVAGFTGIIRKT